MWEFILFSFLFGLILIGINFGLKYQGIQISNQNQIIHLLKVQYDILDLLREIRDKDWPKRPFRKPPAPLDTNTNRCILSNKHYR